MQPQTLNGQQFTQPVPFLVSGIAPYTEALELRPRSGPAAGHSLVLFSTISLGDGTDYRCRFGADDVKASFDRASGNIWCYTPKHAPEGMPLPLYVAARILRLAIRLRICDSPVGAARCYHCAVVNVSFSLNGRHYENGTASYRFYAEPRLQRAVPASGPSHGAQCDPHMCTGGGHLGTLVTVYGDDLGGGADAHDGDGVHSYATQSDPNFLVSGYLCRFNGTAVPATLGTSDTDSNGQQSGGGTGTFPVVRCHAPGSIPSGDVELRLSLNGQVCATHAPSPAL